MKFIDLPDDILISIFIHLHPKDFLSLCQTCKSMYKAFLRDATYWRTVTSNTFRTPISPLLRTHGERWYNLYRRLKTQTRLYTWGQGIKGNLGQGVQIQGRGLMYRGRPLRGPRTTFARTGSDWPTETHLADEIGVVADIQCGGWSTVVLAASGNLYCTGSIDGAALDPAKFSEGFSKLQYLTQSSSLVVQFSAGRNHILALTDDGEVLSWSRLNTDGLKVKLQAVSMLDSRPSRVAAGWAESSVYIPKVGIVYWQPLKNTGSNAELDAREVRSATIPGTAQHVDEGKVVIEVSAHTMLEAYTAWITTSNELWACRLDSVEQSSSLNPFRVHGLATGDDQLRDIQGSFRNFAVFMAGGKVVTCTTDYLERCRQIFGKERTSTYETEVLEALAPHRPSLIPALQHCGVISIRFGDYHYHALHEDGSISAYGRESQSCGALGLGAAEREGRLRGMRSDTTNRDAILLPVSNFRGREIWFEPEKKTWVTQLWEKCSNSHLPNEQILSVANEWIEQEGKHWSQGPNLQTGSVPTHQLTADTPQTRPYFAIAIGAAGWHSGALLLVDEEAAESAKQRWMTTDTASAAAGSSDRSESIDTGTILPNPHPPGTSTMNKNSEQHAPRWIWENQSAPVIELPDHKFLDFATMSTSIEASPDKEVHPWREGVPSFDDLGLRQAST